MKFKGKEISELNDKELVDTSFDLNSIKANYEDKCKYPNFKKKFENRPLPEVNPTFLKLLDEVKEEILKRNLSNG